MKKEIQRYENGVIKSICFEDSGYAVYKFYNEKGQVEKEYSCRNGQYDGVYNEFFSNGQVYKRCSYKNGKLDGLYEEFNPKGERIASILYCDGVVVKNKTQLTIYKIKRVFKVATHQIHMNNILKRNLKNYSR